MAHIGDGNDKAIVASDFFGENCVVKIARSFAVYGYQRQIAQIHAVFAIAGAHFFGDFCGGFQAACAEFVRQFVFAQRDFNFHAAVGVIAQHFGDAGNGGAVVFGIGGDFSHHHLPFAGGKLRHAVGFQNHVLREAFVFGV